MYLTRGCGGEDSIIPAEEGRNHFYSNQNIEKTRNEYFLSMLYLTSALDRGSTQNFDIMTPEEGSRTLYSIQNMRTTMNKYFLSILRLARALEGDKDSILARTTKEEGSKPFLFPSKQKSTFLGLFCNIFCCTVPVKIARTAGTVLSPCFHLGLASFNYPAIILLSRPEQSKTYTLALF